MNNTLSLTKAQVNILKKLETTYGLTSDMFRLVNYFANPCSGERFGPFDPVVSMLLYFAQVAYRNYGRSDGEMTFDFKPVTIAFYDNVRYMVLALDRDAYMNLLD